jgi:hypothetical protein
MPTPITHKLMLGQNNPILPKKCPELTKKSMFEEGAGDHFFDILEKNKRVFK